MQIDNIQEIKELRQRLEGLEYRILKPILTDLNHIPMLYEWYKGIADDKTILHRAKSSEYKQAFLYAVLMLYCPRSISGGSLIYGLRQKLAILFDLSPAHISNLIKDISFHYKKYSEFRNECDKVLSEFQDGINKGLLSSINR